MHWSELIGGDVILTIPYEWQVQFNKSDIEVKPRIDDPVDPAIVDELYRKFAEFRRAYDEDGLSRSGIRPLRRDRQDIAVVHRGLSGPDGGRPRFHAAAALSRRRPSG